MFSVFICRYIYVLQQLTKHTIKIIPSYKITLSPQPEPVAVEYEALDRGRVSNVFRRARSILSGWRTLHGRELSPRPTQIPFSNSGHFLSLAMPGYCIPALQTYDIDPVKGLRRIQSASRGGGAPAIITQRRPGDVTWFGWFRASWILPGLRSNSSRSRRRHSGSGKG